MARDRGRPDPIQWDIVGAWAAGGLWTAGWLIGVPVALLWLGGWL